MARRGLMALLDWYSGLLCKAWIFLDLDFCKCGRHYDDRFPESGGHFDASGRFVCSDCYRCSEGR